MRGSIARASPISPSATTTAARTTDNDGYGDNSDEYPEDPNRALPPSDAEYVPLAGNYSLDTIMLVIVALGVTYFVVKIFVK